MFFKAEGGKENNTIDCAVWSNLDRDSRGGGTYSSEGVNSRRIKHFSFLPSSHVCLSNSYYVYKVPPASFWDRRKVRIASTPPSLNHQDEAQKDTKSLGIRISPLPDSAADVERSSFEGARVTGVGDLRLRSPDHSFEKERERKRGDEANPLPAFLLCLEALNQMRNGETEIPPILAFFFPFFRSSLA